MKYLCIGDIHGDISIVQSLLDNFPQHHLLFVGDFMDSFDHSAFRQVDCVKAVLKAIENGQATALFGNHEFSYLEPVKLKASGHNRISDTHFFPLAADVRRLFRPFVYFPKHRVLVTHAGLTKQLWDANDFTFDTVDSLLTEWFTARNLDSPFYHIGHARGGWDRWGGPLWCDFQDEFTPVPDLIQVFGHSASQRPSKHGTVTFLGEKIRVLEGNYCIDCLQHTREALEFDEDTGVFAAVDIP